eukprot:6136625-Amphidinium_carterae.1
MFPCLGTVRQCADAIGEAVGAPKTARHRGVGGEGPKAASIFNLWEKRRSACECDHNTCLCQGGDLGDCQVAMHQMSRAHVDVALNEVS